MTRAMRDLLEALEWDRALDEPARLRERIEALDRLDVWWPEEPGEQVAGGVTDEADLRRRAGAIRARLEAVNHALFQTIRHAIRHGDGAAMLLPWWHTSGQAGRAAGDGYDYLDELVGGVLRFEPPDHEVAEPAAETVFYQPTPARHVFDLIDRAALSERDVLVDLGSGLGHVPLLVSLCTGARSIGIEWEAAYVACARRCAEALNLGRATFIRQDARAADFSSGTLFYLYTPFTGSVLRSVLDALRREAATREIRIGTYGPCTATIGAERWLKTDDTLTPDRVVLFRSSR